MGRAVDPLPGKENVPRITVIVATYQRGPRIVPTLRSLQAQSFREWEAWVIGDGCTDDTAEVVRELAAIDTRIQWHNLPKNSGNQSVPNTEGLRRARGEFVAFLGHDDLWLPWHLEELLAQADGRALDFVYGVTAFVGPKDVITTTGEPWPGASYADLIFPPSSWLLRRELALRVGGWHDPAPLPMAVDWELARRCLAAGARIACHHRLSVLKFPAADWRAYAASSAWPQAQFGTQLAADPAAVERRILSEVVAQPREPFVQDRSPAVAWQRWLWACRNLTAACRWRVGLWLGTGEGLLARWVRVRYLRRRKRILRPLRGLDPAP